MTMALPNNSNVPDDLIANILVRLPVKSLLRFKCVERRWDAFFKTPTFINNHHTLMQICRKEENEELLMLCHDGNRITVISESQPYEEVQMEHLFPEFDSRASFNQHVVDVYLYGHCKGLFCVYATVREGGQRDLYPEDKLLLWNPATREVKALPPTSHGPTLDDFSFSLRGFGFDPNSDEFEPKVVWLSIESEPPPSPEIYSLKTNSWTLLPNHNFTTCNSPHQAENYFINGVCYWLNIVKERDEPDSARRQILSFDFRNNQFHKMKQPLCPGEVACITLEFITEVNDSIAYVANYQSPDDDYYKIYMWILEQDSSWTIMYNIGPFDGRNVLIYATWKDGPEFLGEELEEFEEGSLESYSSQGDLIYATWKDGPEFLGQELGEEFEKGSLESYSSQGQFVHRFQFPGDEVGYKKVRKYVKSIAPLSF